MQAAVIHPDADVPVVETVPVPRPGDGQVALEVHAVALNPVDRRVASGTHPTIRPQRPYVVGFEGVGRVLDDGAPRRVWWLGGHGTLAQRAVADADKLIEVPDGLSDDLAAAIGIAGMAAWLCLVYRGGMAAGDHVLVLGASGAVGRITVQLARILGASSVTAVARSAGEDLLELGADNVVAIPDDDLEGTLRGIRPEGYDLVIDPLFGPPGEAAVEAAAINGRIVVMGRAAGGSIRLNATVFERGLTIVGHRNSATAHEPRRDAYTSVAEHAAAGRLRIDREVFDLDGVGEAWTKLAGGVRRKLVVTLPPV